MTNKLSPLVERMKYSHREIYKKGTWPKYLFRTMPLWLLGFCVFPYDISLVSDATAIMHIQPYSFALQGEINILAHVTPPLPL